MQLSPNDSNPINRLTLALAAGIGLVLPMIFFGRAPLAVVAGLVIIGILFERDRANTARDVRRTVTGIFGLLVGFLLLAWLPNIFFSPDPAKSLSTLLRSFAFLIAAVGIGFWLARRESVIDTTLTVLVLSVFILAGFSILILTEWPELYEVLRFEELGKRGRLELKETGSAAILMIPLTSLAIARLQGNMRLFAVMSTATLIAVMYLTENRAGVAGFVAMGLVVGAMISVRMKRYWLLAIALAIGLGLVTSAMFWRGDIRDMDAPAEATVVVPTQIIDWHRQTIWAESWAQGEGYRLFGTGINAINKLPGAEEKIGDLEAYKISSHPHNWVIEIAVETGIPGIACLLGILILASLKLARLTQRQEYAPALAAIAIWTGYWVSGLFNFSYWSAWWQVSFFIAMAIALAATNQRRPIDM